MIYDPIGRFQIFNLIGIGGCARVYEALDTTTSKRVALKVLHPDLAQYPKLTYRFARESDILEQLSRFPGFLKYYGTCKLKDPSYKTTESSLAIIMELLEGIDLDQLLQEYPSEIRLNDKETLTIISKVALYLKIAHDNEIVHRDVKSGNIIVLNNGLDPLEIRLIDWGLAGSTNQSAIVLKNEGLEAKLRSSHQNIPLSGKLTEPDSIFGTPDYVAPEVSDRCRDHRSDIFSLGVVLFKMLTNEFPYYGSRDQLLDKRSLPNPKHPDQIRKSKGYKPSRLSCVCMEMLQEDHRDRYQNAAELLFDLSGISV